jgi:5-methyltetrahydropteroyltriglutamate--homocysteine methyltransferase
VSPAPSSAILTSNGAYPRSGNSSEEQILRQTLEAVARGERTAIDVLDAENVVTRFLINEQAHAGVELLTDGQARWADPLSHTATKFEGVVPGGWQKLPGAGLPYRVPLIVGRIAKRPEGPGSLAEEYRFARNSLGLLPTSAGQAGRLSIKPVLVGPYTLARLAESAVAEFSRVEARAEAFAEVLAMEISALAAAGAGIIQLDEPAILTHPEDGAVFRLAFARLAGARDAASQGSRKIQLALHVYGGSANRLLEQLLQVPADMLGLDCTGDEDLPVTIKGRPICAGVVCGWSETIEEVEVIKRRLERMATKAEVSHAGPNTGMGTLLPETAFAKIRNVAAALAPLYARA